jgi:hypothetical protein
MKSAELAVLGSLKFLVGGLLLIGGHNCSRQSILLSFAANSTGRLRLTTSAIGGFRSGLGFTSEAALVGCYKTVFVL